MPQLYCCQTNRGFICARLAVYDPKLFYLEICRQEIKDHGPELIFKTTLYSSSQKVMKLNCHLTYIAMHTVESNETELPPYIYV